MIVQGVEGSANALGFFGYAYFQENQEGLRALAVDGGDGGVQPSPDTIADGSYPLSRPLFIYVSAQALEENEALEPFVNNYLENTSQYLEGLYVPLPDSTIEETRTQFEERTTGTIYNEEGELPGGDIESALQESS